MITVQPSTVKKEACPVVAGTDNPHYLEIRAIIEAGGSLPKSLYNEDCVGPRGTRPPRVNRASFSVYQQPQ